MAAFGQVNPKLTKAIRRIARDDSNVVFRDHAEDRMEERGFDHTDVSTCLRRGAAHGPEGDGDRCHVVYLGLHVRVVVSGLHAGGDDWSALEKVFVETVIRGD